MPAKPPIVELTMVNGQWIAQCPMCDTSTSKQDKTRTCGAMQAHLYSAHNINFGDVVTFREK